MVVIKGLQKTTLVDFPKTVAATVFLAGCNFKCGYCYNSDLVFNSNAVPTISHEEFFEFLNKRKKYLDGICITGGEPTVNPDLLGFIEKIKFLGFKVKLDTNGTNPKMLSKLISSNLLDYIAMDIKSSFDSYETVTGVNSFENEMKKSIELIKNSGVDYEFRTTVIPDIINEQEIKKMGKMIDKSGKYYLQQFMASDTTIDKKYNAMESLEKSKLEEFSKLMKNHASEVGIRNVN